MYLMPEPGENIVVQTDRDSGLAGRDGDHRLRLALVKLYSLRISFPRTAAALAVSPVAQR